MPIFTLSSQCKAQDCKSLPISSCMMIVFALAAMLLMISPSVFLAQAVTASVVGTVNDPAGRAIPNVALTLTNQGTNTSTSGTTNGSGNFEFTLVQPGK